MARRKTTRLYWRERGGERRAYADLRAFRDVGGGQEALIAPGESSATTDPDIAERLLTDRVAELEPARPTPDGVRAQVSTLCQTLDARTRRFGGLDHQLRSFVINHATNYECTGNT